MLREQAPGSAGRASQREARYHCKSDGDDFALPLASLA
jgi:hypothetical protein